MLIRAKTREKDTYFEVGIAQSLENRGNLWKKLTNWKLCKGFLKMRRKLATKPNFVVPNQTHH